MRRFTVGLMALVVLVGAVSAKGEIIHRVFITSANSNIDGTESYPPSYPNFGGFHAADYIITYSAFFAGFHPSDWDFYTSVHRAILSTSTLDARDRLPISGPIYNMQGDLIAVSSDDLWDGNLDNGISYDEFGSFGAHRYQHLDGYRV